MQPRVVLSLESGQVVELAHGDLIGRLDACRLRFDDPRISEAHALVSLRGDTLQLLSLRGRFAVDGVEQRETVLRAGQAISFSPPNACRADVAEVVLPDAVLGLEADGLPLQVLLGTTSLLCPPGAALRVRSGIVVDADAWLAFADDGWFLRRAGGGPSMTLVPDVPFDVAGRQITPRLVGLVEAGAPVTHVQASTQPLRLVARFQSVHILRAQQPALVLDGVAARIVSELVLLAGPVGWEVIARDIWADAPPLPVLRGRWDAQVSRLRARLRAVGIRPDLIRADRHGYVELVLGPDDVVVDEI